MNNFAMFRNVCLPVILRIVPVVLLFLVNNFSVHFVSFRSFVSRSVLYQEIMSSRYADYPSASPRCQQIIQTIDLTSQQGIFIYDLNFIQQELEALLIGAIQRRDELQQSNGELLTLPQSSFVRLANGKKPRDFKAERERRRKAFAGQLTRKRRRKKVTRPVRTIVNVVESNLRNLSTVEQFWIDIVEQTRLETLQTIENSIENDEILLKNLHEEIPEKILWKNSFGSGKTYFHPELQHSIVLKQNEVFHERVKIIGKKSSSIKSIQRGKTKIDENLLAMLRRDDLKFTSKNEELEYRLVESIRLKRFALTKAKEEFQRETIRTKQIEIEGKIFEITNSIRQRKRPSDSIVSQSTPLNTSNETEPWRKGRRQSTLRVYDELARLIDEHVELERQLIESQ